MRQFLNADDDWIESIRRRFYPDLHSFLTEIPGPFYAVGHVGNNQYVGEVDVTEETFERILADLSFERNPVACLKQRDGNTSQGSWVLRSHDDQYAILGTNRQLHVTIFRDYAGTQRIFAHNEYDWQDKPLKHLRGTDFKAITGRKQMQFLLDEHTYLDVTGGRHPSNVSNGTK